MSILTKAAAAASLTFGVFPVSMTVAPACLAAAHAVDPAAVSALQRMADNLASVPQFQVHTENTIEDIDAAGHRSITGMSADITVRHPDRMLAVRTGKAFDQRFYYDGKTLTLFSPEAAVYATAAVPATLDGMIAFARENVGIVLPAAYLLYSNAFTLLSKDLAHAAVVGKAAVGGAPSVHLQFSRPGADFEVWVAEGKTPWPMKYVVTDTTTPARLKVTTVFGNWQVPAKVDDALFVFVPPKGASPTRFLPVQPDAVAAH